MDKTNIMVEFSIIGDEFPSNDITEKLKIKPTGYYLKGERINKRNIERTETCWFLSTGYEESLDINHQLNNILKLIKDKKDILKKIKNMFNLEYKFFIVIRVEQNQTPAIYLESETIEFANDIKAMFDFDLYIS